MEMEMDTGTNSMFVREAREVGDTREVHGDGVYGIMNHESSRYDTEVSYQKMIAFCLNWIKLSLSLDIQVLTHICFSELPFVILGEEG